MHRKKKAEANYIVFSTVIYFLFLMPLNHLHLEVIYFYSSIIVFFIVFFLSTYLNAY